MNESMKNRMEGQMICQNSDKWCSVFSAYDRWNIINKYIVFIGRFDTIIILY